MRFRKKALYFCLLLLGLGFLGVVVLPTRTLLLASTLKDLEAAGFSGGILIANGERVIVKEGYGFSSCEDVVANTADTIYAIGSVTKMFAAAAIGQLDAAGLLNIDDPISLYLEDLPGDKANITIKQLLTHTSGLRSYHETQELGDFEAMTRDRAFEEIMGRPLRFAPGSKEKYSNSGYTLLAMLIEKVSGLAYTDYIRERILIPAGMTSTGFWGESFPAVASTPNRILGCSSPDTWEYSWVLVGNGGMVSTISDMHRWVLALQGESVLSEPAKQRLGFDQRMRSGFSDAGGSSQHEFNASITYAQPSGRIVVAISNRNKVRAEKISDKLLRAALHEQ
ncbi:MAG: serine hydrolase domain-containing protein [Leptolyngbyaceae cyanobacterium MO_188.B28]|nr:serine hydrolase domain-containing protein [Leptolyngbyaceae cyanobacterium MO_188.B28]